jgi:hypothetical protein
MFRNQSFSLHFGNGSDDSIKASLVFPLELHQLLVSIDLQIQSRLNDEEDAEYQEWLDSKLEGKRRPPDLDYRDMEFLTKCDRRMRRGKGSKGWIPNYQGWARAPRRSRGGPRHGTQAGRMVSRQPATGSGLVPQV